MNDISDMTLKQAVSLKRVLVAADQISRGLWFQPVSGDEHGGKMLEELREAMQDQEFIDVAKYLGVDP